MNKLPHTPEEITAWALTVDEYFFDTLLNVQSTNKNHDEYYARINQRLLDFYTWIEHLCENHAELVSVSYKKTDFGTMKVGVYVIHVANVPVATWAATGEHTRTDVIMHRAVQIVSRVQLQGEEYE